MLIKNEKGQYPYTTCHVCKRTRQQDFTVMVNLSTDEHPFLVDICDDCRDKPLTFTDGSKAQVIDGIIRDIVEAK